MTYDKIPLTRFDTILQNYFDRLDAAEKRNDARIKQLHHELKELETDNCFYSSKKNLLFDLMAELNKLENELSSTGENLPHKE